MDGILFHFLAGSSLIYACGFYYTYTMYRHKIDMRRGIVIVVLTLIRVRQPAKYGLKNSSLFKIVTTLAELHYATVIIG